MVDSLAGRNGDDLIVSLDLIEINEAFAARGDGHRAGRGGRVMGPGR